MSQSLTPQIAARILDYAREQPLQVDDHLPAQKLADLFRVSRSPVNGALKLLQSHGIVRCEANRGYFLALNPASATIDVAAVVGAEAGEEAYFQIADDRLSGRLADRVSESEIIRRYKLPRSLALRHLTRMAREGWVERLPGKGWMFLPVLTSTEAYRMAYQFRIAIEPAAILQPGFTVDAAAFARARLQQQGLLDGEYRTLSRTRLFEINSQFHEMIVGCSGNPYFTESLKRVNASRRLAEYRKTVDRSRLIGQSLEHLRILDLLEAGKISDAAEFMRFHLDYALTLKSAAPLD
ncbi:GntR family transcriptional regulator [Acidisphaera sp. L21]|uniref:GntR family transcriptional regulator n=1 Tax=Acidisphaera sp. L21 TaxID=1641851 RepID=UPI00131CEA1D|nr:GntR family transcriptional regulator [Acidisphaera sp. L21]